VPTYLGRDANLMAIGQIITRILSGFDDLLRIRMRCVIDLGVFIDGYP